MATPVAAATRAGDAVQIAVNVREIELAVVVLCERGDVEARFEPTRRVIVIVGCVSFGMSQMRPVEKSPKM